MNDPYLMLDKLEKIQESSGWLKEQLMALMGDPSINVGGKFCLTYAMERLMIQHPRNCANILCRVIELQAALSGINMNGEERPE